ncbi:hypothetical protein [Mesonia aestuariivivens]|uniref:Uncharacterized protein n=1 Tax=Mesonia aestuariivivens TaxID=2796128 RepID=A0ABS6VXP6_9FLAO|nr:hypothetical protein [Mesonia aestuariivivens]MBW2960345.1 hypothetical protein [Mesonia aestuariivivens]
MRITKILKIIISFLELILALNFYSFILILIISLFTLSTDIIQHIVTSPENRTTASIVIGLVNYVGVAGFYFAVVYLKRVVK